jgi:hypothetical protein
MKKILLNCLIMVMALAVMTGCQKDADKYILGAPSGYIANLDLRKIWQGEDVTLTKENMNSAMFSRGIVISDHAGNNLPAGLLVIQNERTAGNGIDSLRGIAINIGADAAKYVPGDSVHVNIEGGVLSRTTGILTVNGKTGADVKKIASGRRIIIASGTVNQVLLFPDRYECTQVRLLTSTFIPALAPAETLKGDKSLNDGSGTLTLHTEANATFANQVPPFSANYRGIIFNKLVNGKLVPQHRLSTANNIRTQAANADVPEIIITGFLNDPSGTDTNAEYIQCRATKDIDFAVTPFSVTTTNNAGTTLPLGAPANGWATGTAKTYKIEIKTGTVTKGQFFYVGNSTKVINGPGSTVMSTSKFLPGTAYNATSPKFDAAVNVTGSSTTNLLANSGNAFGIAIFRGLVVKSTSVPIDVVFVHNGGALYEEGLAPTYGIGYRIGNTDLYRTTYPDENDNDVPQPYFLAGENQKRFFYQPSAGTADVNEQGYFFMLGNGIFDTTYQKWVKARSYYHIKLEKTSTAASIESDRYRNLVNMETGEVLRTDTIRPVEIK